MSQEEIIVPKGWELKKLEKVVNFLDRKRIPINTHERNSRIKEKNQNELFPYFGANGQVGLIDDYIFDEELVLLAEDGGHFSNDGKDVSYLISGKTWVNNHAHVLQPKNIEIKYLLYALNQTNLLPYTKGSTRLKLNRGDANNILLRIAPRPIQKQIVKKLDHILRKLEVKKKEILSLIEQNKERINFFEKNWIFYVINREIEKHPKRKEWNIHSLKTMCDFYVPMRDKPTEFDGDIPWLRIDEIKKKFTDGSNAKYRVSKKTIKDMKLRIYPIGTVLCSCSASIGTCTITTEELTTNQTFIGIFPKHTIYNEFLYYYLKANIQILRELGKGTTIPYISRKKFENLQIPCPDSLIQKQIIQNIKSAEKKFQSQKKQFENIKNNYESKIKYINHIQSSVLDSAFSGKLLN
jgi:type I restriction enzyme, S subunit